MENSENIQKLVAKIQQTLNDVEYILSSSIDNYRELLALRSHLQSWLMDVVEQAKNKE